MSFHPTTQRLILRAPLLSDQQDFLRILNDFDVVKNLAPVPYPYTADHFRAFIAECEEKRRVGDAAVFAVTRAMDGAFIGLCAADRLADDIWEFGYWYGKPYWPKIWAPWHSPRAGLSTIRLRVTCSKNLGLSRRAPCSATVSAAAVR